MTQKENINGAEALLLSLIAEDVSTIFGYPGGAIIPIYDKLYSYSDRLTHILTRHEQGAAHAAQGYARATGKVGVCFATSGPGATNLITGIADAMVDSTPMVCVTAQVAASLLGTDAFQEADIISMTMPVTKWSFQVTSASEIPLAMAKAFYIARTGRPGPVLVDIAKNAQIEMISNFKYTPCTFIRSYEPLPLVDASAIKAAAELLSGAQKPLILVGHGVKISRAEEQVVALAEKSGAAMACTLMGLSAVPTLHPLFVGKLGMHGNIAANDMTQSADVILAVGMRFSDRVTGDLGHYAPNAKIIHIDIDNSELGKNVRIDVGIAADAKEALSAILEQVAEGSHPEWIAFGKERYQHEYNMVIGDSIAPKSGDITMGEVVNAVAEKSNSDALIVTDVGQQQMFASRYSKFNSTRSFITSGGLGTMGFGLPAAIGAKMGCPERTVVLLVGDGGLQMTIQELGTIMQNQIDVKIVVLNNSFLGMVRQWQELFFDHRYSFTELVNPDFCMVVAAYGLKSKRVDKREDLQGAVEEMLCSKGAYLLEVVVEREGNVFPMVPAGASISKLLFK